MREQDGRTFEADSVPAQAVHGALEHGLVLERLAGDVEFLKPGHVQRRRRRVISVGEECLRRGQLDGLDRRIRVLEDLLYRARNLLPDPITRDPVGECVAKRPGRSVGLSLLPADRGMETDRVTVYTPPYLVGARAEIRGAGGPRMSEHRCRLAGVDGGREKERED